MTFSFLLYNICNTHKTLSPHKDTKIPSLFLLLKFALLLFLPLRLFSFYLTADRA